MALWATSLKPLNPHNNICIYIHICICAVKLLSGPSLALLKGYYLGQVGVVIWAKVPSDFWTVRYHRAFPEKGFSGIVSPSRFLNFSLELNFENVCFLCLQKHYKIGFKGFCVCVVRKRRRKTQKYNWNFGFGIFCVQMWPFRGRYLV